MIYLLAHKRNRNERNKMGAFFGSRIDHASLEKGKTAVSLGENVIINNLFAVLYYTSVGADDRRTAPRQAQYTCHKTTTTRRVNMST